MSKFIISTFLPVSLVFGGAYAKSIGVTNNIILYMATRIIVTIAIIIPVILFGYRELKKTIIASGPGLITFVLYDKIHNLFGVRLKDMTFEPEYYFMYITMIVIFLFFVLISILILQKSNYRHELKLQTNYQGLVAAEEELRQSNDELLLLNENLAAKNKVIEEAEVRIQEQFKTLKESESRLRSSNEELRVLNEGISKQFKKLQEKENLISTITTKASDAIIITDENNKIEFWNNKAEKIFKYKADEVIGKKLFETIIPERFVEKHINSFEKYKKTGEGNKIGNQIELPALTKDKEEIIIELSLSSVMINNNRHAIGIARNITERNNYLKKLSEQKEIIEQSHKDITDSLIYAKTIQDSLLTPKELIDTLLYDYFILFKPKITVSGDFYYVNKIDYTLIFTVADCTGHGVPGGFLTMLGITYLHEIIKRSEAAKPSEALEILRQRMKSTFYSFVSENKNGLDIALCFIDLKRNILNYSGAYNPIYIIRENELIEYKATNNPIGHHPVEKDFVNNEIQLQNNDVIYLPSDGFQDQFGGERYKKYNKRRFKELLLKVHKLPLNKQKETLLDVLTKWQKNVEQVDDITIMGIKWKM